MARSWVVPPCVTVSSCKCATGYAALSPSQVLVLWCVMCVVYHVCSEILQICNRLGGSLALPGT